MAEIDIENTSYCYDESRREDFQKLSTRVKKMRKDGGLSPDVLHRIRRYFKVKNIYHSNAIEGNILEVGETRQVVELGLTITGKPLKDQAEARNLSHALDFLEELARDTDKPITEHNIREIHSLVLKGIDDGAGTYRSVPVEISGSQFPLPGPESVGSQMRDFGHWLAQASTHNAEAFTNVPGLFAAAVAHTQLVTIHPFIDGNGRVARLLMNLLLMRHGFPIAIITKEDRLRYYDALETSQSSDLTPFIVLLTECIEESLAEYEQAANEQREQIDWAQSLAQKFSEPEKVRAQNEYEVWRNSMELLKSYIRQTTDDLNKAADYGGISFRIRNFGNLEFEKYLALSHGQSAKRTWFFRVDIQRTDKTVRYLFFFGHSYKLKERCRVTLHVAREEPLNSYNYERLENINAANVPDFVEIGYEIHKERFVVRKRNGRAAIYRIEEFGRQFFDDVYAKHFQH